MGLNKQLDKQLRFNLHIKLSIQIKCDMWSY